MEYQETLEGWRSVWVSESSFQPLFLSHKKTWGDAQFWALKPSRLFLVKSLSFYLASLTTVDNALTNLIYKAILIFLLAFFNKQLSSLCSYWFGSSQVFCLVFSFLETRRAFILGYVYLLERLHLYFQMVFDVLVFFLSLCLSLFPVSLFF